MATASFSNGTITISGAVTFESVAALEKQVKGLLRSEVVEQVDMSAVRVSNISALALMLEIKKLSPKVGFVGFSEQLQSMIRVYRVEGLLS